MFPEILTEARSLVLERITSLINAESKVSDSMLYTSTAESKMIRSALLIAASKKNTDLTKSSAINLATSIELLHSYSLIHDDLPSMDNDNIRRGKDSNHIKYGEAIAILSGDALQTLAFEVITNDLDLDSDLKVSAISLLTDACGYKGMVLGQELDITANPINADEEFIKKMHYLKTGKLIEISLVLGLLGWERFSEDKDLIYKLGRSIGVGFQIVDDYLDEFGNENEIGKPIGSDLKNKKINILSILNEEECSKVISENRSESLEIAEKIFDKEKDKDIFKIIDYIYQRKIKKI
jgi:Geranylgeranyl pyrophosphate synthase